MKFALVTTLDDSYVPGFFLTLDSILESSVEKDWDLIVLEWGRLSENNKKLISDFYPNGIFLQIDKQSYSHNLEQDKTIRHWNYNCNHRFDVFGLEQYERVVYFDCDILFELDVADLLNMDVDFAACQMPHYKEYSQTISSKIFNAGLMVIGKKYLNNKTKKDLIDLSNTTPPKIGRIQSEKWVGNQPILNNYFFDKTTWLPQKYNFLVEDLYFESFKDSLNLHFNGSKKPWSANNLEDSFDRYIVSSIKDKTENIILRTRIIKKAREKVLIRIKKLLTKNPKIPFFDFLRKEIDEL